VAYNCMYVLGMLLVMQIRFVGFEHVQSGETYCGNGLGEAFDGEGIVTEQKNYTNYICEE